MGGPDDKSVLVTSTFDTYGNLLSKADGLGNTTSYVYDAEYHLYPEEIRNPLFASDNRQKAQIAWDKVCATALSETDANGDVTAHSYDVLCRKTQTDYADGGQQQFTYLNWGDPQNSFNQVSTLHPSGSGVVYKEAQFDGFGRNYESRSSSGAGGVANASNRVLQAFDTRGNLESESLPFATGDTVVWKWFRYDGMDRPTGTFFPNGKSVSNRYIAGDVFAAEETTDELGNKKLAHFDAFGNEIYRDRFDDASRMRTTYSYDALNRLVEVVDPLGATWSYTYDGHGNLITEHDPDLGCRQMTYDAANRLVEKRFADGALTTFTYDGLSRPLNKTVDIDALQYPSCPTGNVPPTVSNAIPDQSAIEQAAWTYTVPENTFHDGNGDALAFTASLADDSDLPTWLSFATGTRIFSGTPPQGSNGILSIKVSASDGTAAAEDQFDVEIAEDVGETVATASISDLSTSITGKVDFAGDHDWYQVQLQAGSLYRFNMRGSDTGGGTLGNPYLWLHDASGTEIAYDSDGGTGNEALLAYRVTQTGTYYVDAGAWSDGTGTFTIDVFHAPNEVGETIATALVSDVTGPITGTIDFGGDHDWYAVQLQAGILYQFNMRGTGSGGGTLSNPELWLRDSSGNEVAHDNDGGGNHEALLQFSPTQSGTYYVDAGAWSDGTGTFTIDALFDTNEVGNTTTTASSSDLSASITGAIDFSGDHDWYEVQLQAGSLYRFHMRGKYTGGGTLVNSFLWLQDASGNEVAYDSDSGGNWEALLEYRPTQSGTFYIDAGAWSNGIGTFTIDIFHAPNEVGDTVTTASSSDLSGPITGTVDYAGDHDWYEVQLQSGSYYRFHMRGAHTGGGTLDNSYLWLQDASGNEVGYDSDSGGNWEALLEYRPTQNGTFFVDAGAWSDGTGTYTIDIVHAANEVGDTVATASSSDLSAPITGTIDYANDHDWYEVQLQAGVSYQFHMRGVHTGGGTLGNSYLWLHDASGNQVDEDSDSGGNWEALLEYTPTQGGTFYVDAGAWSDGTGTFTIDIQTSASN